MPHCARKHPYPSLYPRADEYNNCLGWCKFLAPLALEGAFFPRRASLNYPATAASLVAGGTAQLALSPAKVNGIPAAFPHNGRGLFDRNDEPYVPLLDYVREVNQRLDARHAGGE